MDKTELSNRFEDATAEVSNCRENLFNALENERTAEEEVERVTNAAILHSEEYAALKNDATRKAWLRETFDNEYNIYEVHVTGVRVANLMLAQAQDRLTHVKYLVRIWFGGDNF